MPEEVFIKVRSGWVRGIYKKAFYGVLTQHPRKTRAPCQCPTAWFSVSSRVWWPLGSLLSVSVLSSDLRNTSLPTPPPTPHPTPTSTPIPVSLLQTGLFSFSWDHPSSPPPHRQEPLVSEDREWWVWLAIPCKLISREPQGGEARPSPRSTLGAPTGVWGFGLSQDIRSKRASAEERKGRNGRSQSPLRFSHSQPKPVLRDKVFKLKKSLSIQFQWGRGGVVGGDLWSHGVLDLKFCPLPNKFCYLDLENPNKFWTKGSHTCFTLTWQIMPPVRSRGRGRKERCCLLLMAGLSASLSGPVSETPRAQNINKQNMKVLRVSKLSLSLARFGGAPKGLSLKTKCSLTSETIRLRETPRGLA